MMSPAESVKLLDAAMRSHGAEAYLMGVQRSFEDAGRGGDALTAGVLRSLLSLGEVETVMHMPAEWTGQRPAGARSRPGLST